MLGTLQPRAFRSLNRVDPLDSISNYYLVPLLLNILPVLSFESHLVVMLWATVTDFAGISVALGLCLFVGTNFSIWRVLHVILADL